MILNENICTDKVVITRYDEYTNYHAADLLEGWEPVITFTNKDNEVLSNIYTPYFSNIQIDKTKNRIIIYKGHNNSTTIQVASNANVQLTITDENAYIAIKS